MRLLIITQKVDKNDPILSFFHRWIEEFAKYCQSIIVICLQKGEYNLPKNIKILSLGKEKGKSKIKYIFNFYKHIWHERKNYDVVFVHMNPVYVILGGFFWKISGKKITLWYTHKSVDWKLCLAEKITNIIFTASKESFRLPSKKVEVTGHGIDIRKFKNQKSKIKSNKFMIITAGRIAEVKNLYLVIERADILKNKNFNFEIKIAGAPILEADKIYFEKLKNLIKKKELENLIKFVGSISNNDIAEFYQSGDIFVNLSDTGSADKVVLEAMATGLNILTSNEAFKNVVSEKYFTEKKPEIITDKIIDLSVEVADHDLRKYIIANHNLSYLAKIITESFN